MGTKFDRQPRFSWYPGHMLKAERALRRTLSLVDLIIEVVDARAPQSTRNPRLNALAKGKPHVLILNKCDRADIPTTQRWITSFTRDQIPCLPSDKSSDDASNKLRLFINKIVKQHNLFNRSDSPPYKPLRAMVIGMPNVGKSTLINQLTRRKKALVGALPGVTRQQQWIKLTEEIELLDTPGVTSPKFDTIETGLRLCLLSIIKDNIANPETVGEFLFDELRHQNKERVLTTYKIDGWPESAGHLLREIGLSRGLIGSGGHVDTNRAAACLVHDFRAGSFGRISLETP